MPAPAMLVADPSSLCRSVDRIAVCRGMLARQPAIKAMASNKWLWLAEHTDTFGGVANYSWLRTVEFHTPANATRLQIIRAGKLALGLTGVRCETVDCGDWYQLRPIGTATVVFLRSC